MSAPRLTLRKALLAALGVEIHHDDTGLSVVRGSYGTGSGVGVEIAFVVRNEWHPRAHALRIGRLRLAAWSPSFLRSEGS